MKLLTKLQKIRVELQDLKLKKSGNNQGRLYYELSDILPAINKLCLTHDISTHFSIMPAETNRDASTAETAVLTIIDNATEEDVEFTSPTAGVELPRGQAIQGLGAKHTYMRRYMLIMAFEIVESDIIDSLNIELTDQVSDEDKKKVESTKTFDELTKVCRGLRSKYKISLITPLFEEQKAKLDQKESKA